MSDPQLYAVPFSGDWHHLLDTRLADSGFGSPSPVDLLLGVDVFSDVMLDHNQNVVKRLTQSLYPFHCLALLTLCILILLRLFPELASLC